MNYIVTGSTYNSKFIPELVQSGDIRALSGEELEHSSLEFAPSDKVYVPSETSLSIVMDRMQDRGYVEGIKRLKDKFLCREALSTIYPDFFYDKASLAEIPNLDLGAKKVVIKPIKGFFGTGVRIADKDTDLKRLVSEMNQEVHASARFFSRINPQPRRIYNRGVYQRRRVCG